MNIFVCLLHIQIQQSFSKGPLGCGQGLLDCYLILSWKLFSLKHHFMDRSTVVHSRYFHISQRQTAVKHFSLALHWFKTVRKEADHRTLTHPHLQSSNKNLKKDPMAWLISPASCKLEVSDFKGAVDLACTEDTLFRK